MESPLSRSPLLPDRHPQLEFFVCDIFDAVPKSDMASMAHPFFSLSTKPDTKPREYHSPDGKHFIKINPSVDGIATIHDRDVIIFCISQIMAALNEGRKVSRVVRFKAYDFLVATNRQTNGEAYKGLKMAFKRLQGTQIETNVTAGGKEQYDVFGLIDRARIVRETRDGRMLDAEVELSDWVFDAIEGNEVLTLSRDYFRLRKPLERRLYDLARKHCGQNKEWMFTLEKLQAKTGSLSTPREFRRMLKSILDQNKLYSHIPDYDFDLVEDTLHIRPKHSFAEKYANPSDKDFEAALAGLVLRPQTYETAKKHASGYDVYGLESDWRIMLRDKTTIPENPQASFIGYVKWYVKEHGSGRGSAQRELF